MALSARFSLLHSNLNDFLFASVGEEQNGVTLSVVSALTRLGLDPWEEAARLTPLPKPRAAEALATLIARLPISRTLSSDDLAISQRLVELLPDQKSAPLQGRERVQRLKGSGTADDQIGCGAARQGQDPRQLGSSRDHAADAHLRSHRRSRRAGRTHARHSDAPAGRS